VSEAARQRVDLWLFRARFAKTRAEAARIISEGGVRIVREGASRQIDKPSAEIAVGDALVLPLRGRLRTVEVAGLGDRRGPASEARLLYRERDAEGLA
jgi:ribosome-associated heat shock protein Hsp15